MGYVYSIDYNSVKDFIINEPKKYKMLGVHFDWEVKHYKKEKYIVTIFWTNGVDIFETEFHNAANFAHKTVFGGATQFCTGYAYEYPYLSKHSQVHYYTLKDTPIDVYNSFTIVKIDTPLIRYEGGDIHFEEPYNSKIGIREHGFISDIGLENGSNSLNKVADLLNFSEQHYQLMKRKLKPEIKSKLPDFIKTKILEGK